ncbi:MAG: response regulator transcription factor [Sandaracinaceae bacterium]|nr:response regulator transcription factor [Sandaracinaceae bacterium]
MIRRVLVLEDHDATRAALVEALGRETSFVAIGVATRAEALAEVAKHSITLALVDLRLGDERGSDAIRELVARDVPCIALTVIDDADEVLGALRAGATGYVLKSDPLERLVAAIADALRGDVAVSSRVVRHLVQAIQPLDLPVPLTPRERDLLLGLARGLTYAECADLLRVQLGTVQSYVKTLYAKLEVTSKTEACAWAMRHGLVE